MNEFSLDFQTNLLNTLNQSLVSLNKLNDTLLKSQKVNTTINDKLVDNKELLNEGQKITKSNNVELEKVVDKYDDINTTTKSINKNFGIFSGLMGGLQAGIGAIAGGFLALFSTSTIVDAINMNKEYQQTFLDLSYRMGDAGKSSGQYISAMHSITQYTGLSNEVTTELVANLAKYRVSAKDINDLGKTTAMFSEITGVSVGEATRLTGELMRVGRVGKDSTKIIMFNMAQVQRSVGLTDNEMSELNDNIISNTRLLSNMGKSSADIEKFAKTTTNLSGAFVKVGLSINDAQDIMDRFLDPTKFEDNALLFAQLGYSFSDVINGTIPQEELQGRLKDLGAQVKGMGMAGVELAKQLNVPYKTLTQMDKLDLDPLAGAETGADKVNSQMKTMQEQQESWGKNMDHSINRLKDGLTSAFDKMVPVLNKITNGLENFIAKTKFGIIVLGGLIAFALIKAISSVWKRFSAESKIASIDTSSNLSKGINSGIDKGYRSTLPNMGKAVYSALSMNTQKAMKELEKRKEITLRVKEEVYQQRRAGSQDYKQRAVKVEFFDERAQMQQLAFSKRMLANHSEWLFEIQKGSKMTSGLAYATAKMTEKMKERIALAERDNVISEYSYGLVKEQTEERQKLLTTRILELKALQSQAGIENSEVKFTARQTAELKLLMAEEVKNASKIDKLNKQREDEETRLTKLRLLHLKTLSGTDLLNMEKKIREDNQQRESQLKTLSVTIDTLDIEKDSLIKAKERNDITIQNLQVKALNNKLNETDAKKLMEALEIQKNINSTIELKNNELEESRIKQQELTEESIKQLKLADEAKEIAATKKSAAGFGEIATTPFYRVSDYLKKTFFNAGGALLTVGHKMKTSLTEAAKVVGDKLNPKNILADLKTKGLKNLIFGGDYKVLTKNGEEQTKHTKGLIKSMGGLLGGVGALAATMGIMSFLMKPITPLLEPIGKAVDSMMQVVVKNLLPIIQKLAVALLPIAISLVNTLLPKLLWALAMTLQVIGFLVSTIGNLIKFLIELPDNLKMMFKALPLFGGKTKEQQMAESLKEGKSKKEQDAIDKLSKKELEDAYKKQKYVNNGIYTLADTISTFGDTLTKSGKDLAAMNIVTGKQKLIDEKTSKELIDTMNKDIATAGQFGKETIAPQAPAAPTAESVNTPKVFAATKEGIKKTEDGSTTAKKEDVAAKTAENSGKTADGVNTVAKNQGVQVSIEQQMLEEIKKLNENFKTMFNKPVMAPAGVTGRK